MSKSSKIGRPTNYRAKFCEEIIEYFNIPLYREVVVEKMAASGAVKKIKMTIPNDMPTFEGFALDVCGVAPSKLTEWAKKHEEFRKAMEAAKGIQKRFILTHGLGNGYNAGFAKFFAINNLDMKESSHLTTENEHKVEGYGLAFDLSKKPEEL